MQYCSLSQGWVEKADWDKPIEFPKPEKQPEIPGKQGSPDPEPMPHGPEITPPDRPGPHAPSELPETE
jgi:hypothetical protein